MLGSIKGDRLYTLENLARLLELVGESSHKEQVINWPNPSDEITLGAAVSPIANSGLLLRDGSTLQLSTDAKEWLKEKNPERLIEIFHEHVRFIGEILNELTQRSMSAPELLRIACAKYSFAWGSSTPIHSRTRWLEVAGLIKSFSHKVHISDTGRLFLEQITVYEPETVVLGPSDLQPAPQVLGDLLERVRDGRATRARAASCYIPGVKANHGQIGAIRAIVESCSVPTRDEVVAAKAATSFGTGTVAAETAIRSLKLLGLLERTSASEISATPCGLAWISSNYAIDLARIVQAHIWYFAEIVNEVRRNDKLTFSEILDRCRRYSSDGLYEPLKRGGLTARLALLESLGLVVDLANGSYKATPLGVAFLDSVPIINPIDPTEVGHPPKGFGDTPREAATGQTRPTESHRAADEIADNLIKAARASGESRLFELAVVESFNFLGLPAIHIGGGDGPDGIVRTRPGNLGATLTLEAKSAADGVLEEKRAEPITLAEHRSAYRAEATVFVGPGFERRLLGVLDKEPVAVVSTALLAEAVRRQRDTPLTPQELLPLLDPATRESDRREQLLAVWRAKENWSRVMRAVVNVLSREADSPMSAGDQDSSDLGWLSVADVRRSLRDALGQVIEESLIKEILHFLSLDQIAVAEKVVNVKDKEDARYRLQVDRAVMEKHFDSLGRQWQLGGRLGAI